MSLTISLAAAVVMTLVAGFFQLSEAAVLSADFGSVRQLSEHGDKKGERVLKLRTSCKNVFNVVTRAVSALCAFGIGMISLRYIYPWLLRVIGRPEFMSEGVRSSLIMLLLFLAVSGFFIIFGQIIPRKVGIFSCETLSYKIAGAISFFLKLLHPYIFVIMGISNLVVRIFGVPAHADEKIASEEEILMMVDASGSRGVIEESEADMIANIFEFGDTTASEAMTHRTDVEGLEYTSDVTQAVNFALQSGFSRIPVYKDDLDNIQGVLYVKDLLKFVGNQERCTTPVYEIMRPACYIPETKRLSELFGEMTETKVQMAVVVDEYGGTSGIITMEDLIESILGNIQDEFDNEDEEINQVNENTFTVDGTIFTDELSDLLDIEIPEGDYDTLAGYIVSTLGRIPTEAEHPTVSLGDYDFTVEQVSDRRVSRVRVEKVARDAGDGEVGAEARDNDSTAEDKSEKSDKSSNADA